MGEDFIEEMSEVVIYYASVSGTAKTKKDTQNLRWLLDKKSCAYDQVDVAVDPVARGMIKKKSGHAKLPQLYVDGKYVGGYDECQQFEEEDLLDDYLDGNPPRN